jgi:uncharacterized protein
MVLPTLKGRDQVLDAMRGLAVLGILIANIASFATPDFGGMSPGNVKLTGLDLRLDALTTVFVTGKMRSMLAILFGIGVWLQYQKRSQIPGNWPGGYLKRSLWLALIGLCHGFFVWFGDILFFYAGMAIVTALFAPVEARVLKGTVTVAAILGFLGGLLLLGLLLSMPSRTGSHDEWPFTSLDMAAAFRQGTYLDQLKVRALLYLIVLAFYTVLGIATLPLFLLGLLFGRSGVLVHPSRHRRTRNAALGIGFGLGLPLNLLGMMKMNGRNEIDIFVEFVGGPILAVGYLMLGAVLVERGGARRITGALAKVGRVALTTYLSQSVLASIVFYSWGFGQFGRLSLAGQLGVVAGIWAVNLLFAHLWLRRFAMGPVEWLLRSLTEGKRLPNGRDPDSAFAGA